MDTARLKFEMSYQAFSVENHQWSSGSQRTVEMSFATEMRQLTERWDKRLDLEETAATVRSLFSPLQ